jgi:hydrogenase nickel incorporation protein HypB
VDCSVDKIVKDSLNINPDLAIFKVSCKTGEGLEDWYRWLQDRVKEKSQAFKDESRG